MSIRATIRAIVAIVALGVAGDCLAGEFQVNTYTTDDQRAPAVASDGAGSSVVVWQSSGQDGDANGVYAQRYDSQGAAVGPEFRVNVTTYGAQRAPDVGMASDGSFAVVWDENSIAGPDGSGNAVFMRLFDPAGLPTGSAMLVNTYTTGDQGHPAIAMADDGDFVVTWESNGQDGDSGGMFGQRFDSTGALVSSEFQVNTYTTGVQGESKSVDIAPDGSFVAVWHSRAQDDGVNSVSGGGVYAQRFGAAAGTVGAEFLVNTTTSGAQGHGGTDVVVHDDGSFVIVWNGNNASEPFLPGGDIFARRFGSDGSPLGDEFRINANSKEHHFAPSIAADASQNFLVAYRGVDDYRDGVYARYFQPDGTAIGTEFLVNVYEPGDQDDVSVSADPAGRFFVTWNSDCRRTSECGEDQDGDEEGVFARRLSSIPPVCSATPRSGCDTPSFSKLLIRAAGKVVWKWRTDSLDEPMGEPASGLTGYVLCVYEQEGAATQLLLEAGIPAGEDWSKSRGSKPKFRYRDATGTPDGVQLAKLSGVPGGKGKIRVVGKGPNLAAVPLPLGSFDNVTVQLTNGDDDCREAVFTSAQANKDKVFKALLKD